MPILYRKLEQTAPTVARCFILTGLKRTTNISGAHMRVAIWPWIANHRCTGSEAVVFKRRRSCAISVSLLVFFGTGSPALGQASRTALRPPSQPAAYRQLAKITALDGVDGDQFGFCTALAGKIQTLLLEQTPIVIPYFIDGLTATKSSVHGVSPTSISQLFLGQAYKD